MPSRSGIFAFQPNELIFEMSRSLRGVPSGLARSQVSSPLKPTTSQINSASSRIVRSVPGADVDNLGAVVVLEKEKAGRREVVDVKKFTARLARTPDHDFARAGLLRFMRLAQKRGEDMRGLEIEVVIRPVKIRRHGRDEVRTVLARISLAELDPGDLGNGVGFIRRFERPA